jgi:hypothetical protein
MGKFLNFCPIIGYNGTKMASFDVEGMLEQLKKAYVDKVVRHGFEDAHLYNDNLLKLDAVELKKFDELKKQIGATKASHSTGDVDINNQGLTDEQYEKVEKAKKKPIKRTDRRRKTIVRRAQRKEEESSNRNIYPSRNQHSFPTSDIWSRFGKRRCGRNYRKFHRYY